DLEVIEKDVREQIGQQKALLEISKYPVKDTDIIQGDEVTSENVETLKTFEHAFSYKRLISYGGLMKEIHKELNLQDVEDQDADLIEVDGGNKDELANSVTEVIAYWNIGLRDYIVSQELKE
ncbi:protein rep, partial [Priestia aryabhattai]|uniref:protein rep n=1 Tax=Priestia aryabhattai TaxID=412384 RepID=UPI002E1E7695